MFAAPFFGGTCSREYKTRAGAEKAVDRFLAVAKVAAGLV